MKNGKDRSKVAELCRRKKPDLTIESGMSLAQKIVDVVTGGRSSYRLEYSDYYHDESKGPASWHSVDIRQLGVADLLLRFDRGEITTISMVGDLFSAFYNRDFSGSGKHWCHDGQRVCPVAVPDGVEMGPDTEAFECSESSTWDWKDIYAVAESRGICLVDKANKLIRMKDYKFYCSG